MASKVSKVASGGWQLAWRKYQFNSHWYREMGLLKDDMLREDVYDDVKEALRRLPKAVYDQRTYRVMRAFQLDLNRQVLPKAEWTKFEDDKPYLQPYLEEVRKELKEKEEWNSK